MKKHTKKPTKLNLNTETIQTLTARQLELINGGALTRNTNTCTCIDTALCE